MSGPEEVSVGDTVRYVLEISYIYALAPLDSFDVIAEVPNGWQLTSATYEGTLRGEPTAGNGLVVQSDICDSFNGPVRSGFRRWHIQPSTLPTQPLKTDIAELTLEFQIGSQPTDGFELVFGLGGQECSAPEVLAINRPKPRLLTLLQKLPDAFSGLMNLKAGESLSLNAASRLTLAPGGSHLYAVDPEGDSIDVYHRDLETGLLTFAESTSEGLGGADGLDSPFQLEVSPDGVHAYLRMQYADSLAIYSRDTTTGSLALLDRGLVTTFQQLALSPDGNHVYIDSPSGIIVYSRNQTSGLLTQLESQPNSGTFFISPDGHHLYSYYIFAGSLDIFSRDAASGHLDLLETLPIADLRDMAFSPDGLNVYVLMTPSSDLILVPYERDPTTGLLTETGDTFNLTSEWVVPVPSPNVAASPPDIAVSPNGNHLIVAGSHAILLFNRNPLSGKLRLIETYYNGNFPGNTLLADGDVLFSPDGRQLYTTTAWSQELLAYDLAIDIFKDGFESGTTSTWSAKVP